METLLRSFCLKHGLVVFFLLLTIPAFTATYVVDNTADTDDNTALTPFTLRKCIRLANANPGADVINFSISGTITLVSQFPDITGSVTLDGTTASGYTACNPKVEINGGGANISLLYFAAGAVNSIVKALVLNNASNGIFIAAGANNMSITGCFIGLDVTGLIARPNKANGMAIYSNNNTIGGNTCAERNVISNNQSFGIYLENGTTSKIIGNYVGVNVNGTAAMGNYIGINISASPNSIIDNNIVNAAFGGNPRGIDSEAHGIYVQGGSNATLVRGNKVGVDVNGAGTNLGNHGNGITVVNSTNCTVGGLTPGEENIVANNGFGGNGAGISLWNAQNTKVLGNIIGLNSDKTTANGNYGFGIWSNLGSAQFFSGNYIANTIVGAATTGIGLHLGSSASATIKDNFIFGNASEGIDLTSSLNDTIWNNKIGVDQNGAAKGNLGNGINMITGSDNALIGDMNAANANEIANNGKNGININGSSVKNAIHKNSIYCNALRGIELNSGLGNNGYAAPVVDPSSNSTLVKGTAPVNAFVEIFSIGPSPCVSCTAGAKTIQGKTYITTVTADNLGNWSYTPGAALTETVVVTASESSSGKGNTSEFSACPLACVNPVFTINPVNETICEGGTVTLTASATGAASYKWQEKVPNGTFADLSEGGVYSGTLTASLKLTGVTLAMNLNEYRSVAVAGACSTLSTNNVLTVDSSSAVDLLTASANQLCAGTAFSLTLASARGTITWESSLNGSAWAVIPNESSLKLDVTGLSQTTYYRASVKSGVCSVTSSNEVQITVDPKIVITTQPQNTGICGGSNVAFSISATGNTLGYQWQERINGTVSNLAETAPYSGVLSDTLRLSGIPLSYNNRAYRVVLTGGQCSDTSAFATLNVVATLSGGTISGPLAICQGSADPTLTLSGSSGNIQWQDSSSGSVAFADINGAVNATYTPVGLTKTTYYKVVVTNGVCAPGSSAIFKITVDAPVSITQSPLDAIICENSGTSFTAGTAAIAPAYKWQVNEGIVFTDIQPNALYTGENSATLNLLGVPLSMSGYSYRCIISSGTCSDTTLTALLTVDSVSVAGTITGPASICQGSADPTLVLSGYTGTIQWQDSTSGSAAFTDVPGATANQYTAIGLTKTTYYKVLVDKGACSPANSRVHALVVDAPVNITQSPTDKTVCENGSTSFTVVEASGTFKYQWQEKANGVFTDISNGATYSGVASDKLQLSNVSLALSGQVYRCVITNGACSGTSGEAVLTVNELSKSSTITGPSAICLGTVTPKLTLSPGYTGTIQWQDSTGGAASFNDIPSATNPDYTAIGLTKTTYYKVMVTSGVCGPVKSPVIKVQVDTPSEAGLLGPLDSIVCSKSKITLNLSGSQGAIKWQVSTDTTKYVNWSDLTSSNTTVEVEVNGRMFYRAIVKSGVCSVDSSRTATVSVYSAQALLLGNDTSICEPSDILLKAPSGYTAYLWSDGRTGLTSIVTKPGTYWLEATASNSCITRDTIIVKPCKTIFIPNIFTPNSDGTNEFFTIQGIEPDAQVQIYNRWGLLLHDFKPYTNNWDGADVVDGVYYYIYIKPSDKQAITGFVEVIR